MKEKANSISISLCLSLQGNVYQELLCLPFGATVNQALKASKFFQNFSKQNVWELGVGIFGKPVNAQTLLKEGDRIEMYRSLHFDPMISRRRRANHKVQQIKGQKYTRSLSLV